MNIPPNYYSHGKVKVQKENNFLQVVSLTARRPAPGVFWKSFVKKNVRYVIHFQVQLFNTKQLVIIIRRNSRSPIVYRNLLKTNNKIEKHFIKVPWNQIEIGLFFVRPGTAQQFTVKQLFLTPLKIAPKKSITKHLSINKHPLEITQIWTSSSIRYFRDKAKAKYNLTEYNNPNRPAIFFGCYKPSDFRIISRHRSLAVVVWGGTDAKCHKVMMYRFKARKNIYHIAQSSFIERDLRSVGIRRYLYLPFSPTVTRKKYQPAKKGPYVYVYSNPNHPYMYGSSLYKQVMMRMPKTKFILTCQPSALRKARMTRDRFVAVHHSKIHMLYQQCFIGLRLTGHDGISATVQELGMMGIRTIHNGKTPACIPYRNVRDIIRIIREEKKKIGTVDHEISQKTEDHLQQCDLFLKKLFVPVVIQGKAFALQWDGSSPEMFRWRTTNKRQPVYELSRGYSPQLAKNKKELKARNFLGDFWGIFRVGEQNQKTLLEKNTISSIQPPIYGWRTGSVQALSQQSDTIRSVAQENRRKEEDQLISLIEQTDFNLPEPPLAIQKQTVVTEENKKEEKENKKEENKKEEKKSEEKKEFYYSEGVTSRLTNFCLLSGATPTSVCDEPKDSFCSTDYLDVLPGNRLACTSAISFDEDTSLYDVPPQKRLPVSEETCNQSHEDQNLTPEEICVSK